MRSLEGDADGDLDTTRCYAYSDSIAPTDANAPAVDFVDISTTGTYLPLTDDSSQQISIGFDFNYYGIWYGHVWVSSNGFLSFPGDGDGCCQGGAIPATTIPNGIIAGFWKDLYPPNGAI